MFFTGLAIFSGVALIFAKLRKRVILKALNHDAAIDVAVTVLTTIVHFGTFSGLISAAIAGLLTSMATSTAKRVLGYIRGGVYYPGLVRLENI